MSASDIMNNVPPNKEVNEWLDNIKTTLEVSVYS